jgi:glutamate N-acetyltransferase/amino-acid N-acetyltransferase
MNYSVPGFLASGIAGGIKKESVRDLGLLTSEKPATTVGVFTTNKVQAAPVKLTKDKIQKGKAQALIVNSGNANACTGIAGLHDAQQLCQSVATELTIGEELVMVSSTGIIGVPLPMNTITPHIPRLVAALSPVGLEDFAEAIMTTDTFPKLVIKKELLAGKEITLCGIAKGSGMIMPCMATLLSFIITDVAIERVFLKDLLREALETSFNRITIDGETSTNDMVIMMANGNADNHILKKQSPDLKTFRRMLHALLEDLSHLILKDAEGSTKIIHIRVENARTQEEGKSVAYRVANSLLVKTAFCGEDANWGRILAAVGQTGADIDPERIDIFFDDVMLIKNSICTGATARAQDILKQVEFRVTINLNSGSATAEVATTDITPQYVEINSAYPT